VIEIIPKFLLERLTQLPEWNLQHFRRCQRNLLSRPAKGFAKTSMILGVILLAKVPVAPWIIEATSLRLMAMIVDDHCLLKGTEMRVDMIVILIWLIKDVVEALIPET